MLMIPRFARVLLLAVGGLWSAATALAAPGATLWYRQPANQWVEALPLGNGRLGAMIFGGLAEERLQLNEDTLWSGGPYDPANPEALVALPEVRRLLFAGEYAAAQRLTNDKLMGKPAKQMAYQTAGDLRLTFPATAEVSGYRRELDLDTAIARTTCRVGEVEHVREAFISPVDQVLVVRLGANRPGAVSFTALLDSPQQHTSAGAAADSFVLRGRNGASSGIPGELSFEVRVQVRTHGGKSQVSADGKLVVDGADAVELRVAMATNFRRYNDVSGDPAAANERVLAVAAGKSFDALRSAHIAEHQRLFRRVSIDLGTTAAAESPTDERVRQSATQEDPALAALYFQYGRYLLISSSRPGTQPANLQGIWNDSLTPPWGSKHTININAQMNYWPAEVANLAECAEPLFDLIRDLSETGVRTAKVHYDAPGWVAHHNTDLWRATAPIDGGFYGMWPTGGAWLCYHLWDHYLYGGDREFLARAYPVMKGAAEFFVATLVEDPETKHLVTAPSMSPENAHRKGLSLAAGPTMDEQIIRDLFDTCAEAARVLGIDEPFRRELQAKRARLAPNRIGASGQLQEWQADWDAAAPDRKHRHVSHLYGFFPSSQITLRGTPELAAAVRRTLETRGDISTGWAIAWRLNLWARQQDGDRTHRILRALLDPSRTYPNLFDAHPPFQIDGNFGGTSAIAEMLLQTHAGEIELLPALPKAWPTGSVTGLRARGGFEVDLAWRDGALTRATLRSARGGAGIVRLGAKTLPVELPAGGTLTLDGALKK